jgi:hypothetical protein
MRVGDRIGVAHYRTIESFTADDPAPVNSQPGAHGRWLGHNILFYWARPDQCIVGWGDAAMHVSTQSCAVLLSMVIGSHELELTKWSDPHMMQRRITASLNQLAAHLMSMPLPLDSRPPLTLQAALCACDCK